MLDLLRGLKSLVKLSHVQIDSSIFRLHYTITVMACLAFSLLVTARQYVGNPIDCVHTKDIPEVPWKDKGGLMLKVLFFLSPNVSLVDMRGYSDGRMFVESFRKMIELFFNSNQKVSISYNGLSSSSFLLFLIKVFGEGLKLQPSSHNSIRDGYQIKGRNAMQ